MSNTSAASGSHQSSGQTGSGTGTGKSKASHAPRFQENICSFRLRDRTFGLSVRLVGEVVSVDNVAPVPMARTAMIGVFNLRGTPVALVDTAAVLELGDVRDNRRTAVTALVVRVDQLVVGLAIDAMEAVIPAGRGTLVAPQDSTEHPAVQGFLELADGTEVITVLHPEAVLERLERLRYVADSEDQERE